MATLLITPSSNSTFTLPDPSEHLSNSQDGKLTFYADELSTFKIVSHTPIIVYSPYPPIKCYQLSPASAHAYVELEAKQIRNEFGFTTKCIWVTTKLHGSWMTDET